MDFDDMDDRALARIPTRWEPKMATGFVEKSLSMATRQTYQRNVREFFAFVDYVHPARVTSDDVRALRISVVLRGYRMTEVDWLIDQFALTLDERDAEIAALNARLHPPGTDSEKAVENAAESPTDDEEQPHG